MPDVDSEPAFPSPDDRQVHALGDLAVFLGGSEDSFTGQLLQLAAKADPGDRRKLRAAYPREVTAFEVWMSHPMTPTWAELRDAMDGNGLSNGAGRYIETSITVTLQSVETGGALVSLSSAGEWADPSFDRRFYSVDAMPPDDLAPAQMWGELLPMIGRFLAGDGS